MNGQWNTARERQVYSGLFRVCDRTVLCEQVENQARSYAMKMEWYLNIPVVDFKGFENYGEKPETYKEKKQKNCFSSLFHVVEYVFHALEYSFRDVKWIFHDAK